MPQGISPNPLNKISEVYLSQISEHHKKDADGNTIPHEDELDEAKVDQGRSDYGKASIRNYRRMGPGYTEPGMFDPEGKRGKTIEKRREEHKARRGVKGAKVPAYKVDEGSSYGLYRGSGKPSGAMKKYLDNAKKMQEADKKKKKTGNPAFDDPSHHSFRKSQYNSHELQGEVVSEMGGMQIRKGFVTKSNSKTIKSKNEMDMSKGSNEKAPVDYRTLAQSHVPVGNIFNEKKMDPVGQEDGDINNDGKKDSTDSYLMKRRKAIGKAIAKKRGKVKEGFSAWRIDLDFNEQVKK